MSDENNLLLQTILHEQRNTRDVVNEITKTMASKEDLVDYRAEMKNHFDDLRENVQEQAGFITDLKTAEIANTSFRKGFINGVRYVSGAVFVALLGIASAVVPSYLLPHNSQVSASASANPTPTTTPFKPMHLNIPPQ